MLKKLIDKLKNNSLEAIGDTVGTLVSTGNPVSSIVSGIGTLIGNKDVKTENDLIRELSNPESLKILKEHDQRMKELGVQDREVYIEQEKNKMNYIIEKFKSESADRDSARKMGIKSNNKFQNKYATMLTIVSYLSIIVAIAGYLFFIIYGKKQGLSSEMLITITSIISGFLGHQYNNITQILSYFYGSMIKDD